MKPGPVGLADEAERYTRMAGEIAIEARDRPRPRAYVAGGMAPPYGGRDAAPVDREDLPREFAMRARVLAGVDVILPEYVGWIEDCVAAVDAVSGAGLPVMPGVRHVTAEGAMRHGESFEDLVTALGDRPVEAILLMCSPPEHVDAGPPRLRAAFDGPVGAYPNIGYGESDENVAEGGHFHSLDTASHGPDRLAAFARRRFDDGARVVGGCRATTPDRIAAIRALV